MIKKLSRKSDIKCILGSDKVLRGLQKPPAELTVPKAYEGSCPQDEVPRYAGCGLLSHGAILRPLIHDMEQRTYEQV